MSRLITGVFRILGSLKFTAFIIIALSIIFLLGLWIPQRTLIGGEIFFQWRSQNPGLVAFLEAIGFTHIYTSFITLSLWILFFLNLILVMWKRFSLIVQKISNPDLDDSFEGYQNYVELSINRPLEIEDIKGSFRGYMIYGRPDRFIAIKNRFAPLGTIFFHLSFFLLLFGGIITVYTRFTANLDLGEGEIFTGNLEQYTPPVRLPKIGSVPQVKFMVEKVEPEIEQDIPTDLKVTIRDDKGNKKIIRINHPLEEEGTFFVIKNIGVAPLIILYDKDGKEIDGAYVKLNVLKGREDNFIFQGYMISASFYPDFYMKNNEPASRSEVIRNPAFKFRINSKGSIKEVILRPGERIKLNGEEIAWVELPYWVRFYVVRERGLYIVYSGFILAITGLIWRLIFYRKEIKGIIKCKDNKVILILGGKAEFYKALFSDEFKKTVDYLLNRL